MFPGAELGLCEHCALQAARAPSTCDTTAGVPIWRQTQTEQRVRAAADVTLDCTRDTPGVLVGAMCTTCQCECVACSACARKNAPTSAPATTASSVPGATTKLDQVFAHCPRFLTAAARKRLGRVSVPVWPIILFGGSLRQGPQP